MNDFQGDILNRSLERRPWVAAWGRRSPRILATLFAVIVDFSALLTASLLGAFLKFGSGNHAMLLEFLPFVVTMYYSAAIIGGAYSIESFYNLKVFISRSIYSMFFGLMFIALAFFSLKIGVLYSRGFLALTIFFSIVMIGLFRRFSWTQVTRILGQNAWAELVISDGIEHPPVSGAAFLDAAAAGLLPDPTDLDCVKRFAELASNFDRIIVHCGPDRRKAWTVMLKCLAVRGEIRISELDTIRPLTIVSRSGQISAVVSEHPLEWHQAVAKRAFDLIVTIALSPLFLPMILITAIAIKLDSRGPVFFKQQRIGIGNRSFMMLKFRSMRIESQDNKAARLTERNDARVTRVGAFIRTTSIDELPQFLNVLLGDMSIVGPRPHAPMALAGDKLYWEVDQKYWHRHVAKPGITGLAQVRGFRGNTFDESDLQNRLDADLEYVVGWSLLQDIEIVLATLWVLKHDRAF
jgi:polysaccharide biosynthesis protein PslA